jgi:hypothetical protein
MVPFIEQHRADLARLVDQLDPASSSCICRFDYQSPEGARRNITVDLAVYDRGSYGFGVFGGDGRPRAGQNRRGRDDPEQGIYILGSP